MPAALGSAVDLNQPPCPAGKRTRAPLAWPGVWRQYVVVCQLKLLATSRAFQCIHANSPDSLSAPSLSPVPSATQRHEQFLLHAGDAALTEASTKLETVIGDRKPFLFVYSPDDGLKHPMKSEKPGFWTEQLSRLYTGHTPPKSLTEEAEALRDGEGSRWQSRCGRRGFRLVQSLSGWVCRKGLRGTT